MFFTIIHEKRLIPSKTAQRMMCGLCHVVSWIDNVVSDLHGRLTNDSLMTIYKKSKLFVPYTSTNWKVFVKQIKNNASEYITSNLSIILEK